MGVQRIADVARWQAISSWRKYAWINDWLGPCDRTGAVTHHHHVDLYGNTADTGLIRSWWLPPVVLVMGIGASITASWLPIRRLLLCEQS